MKVISILHRVVLAVVALTIVSPLRADWQTDHNVTIYVQKASKLRTFTWTGQTDADGKAQGKGTYTAYFKGRKAAVYTGVMNAGRMDGQVSASYLLTHQSYEGEIRDGNENGYGTMTYPDGTRRTGHWVDGKLVDSTPRPASPGGGSLSPLATPAATEIPDHGPEITPTAPPTGKDDSAAVQFVRELSFITARYFMEVAYRQAPSDDYSDAFWAGGRAQGVADLLKSPLAQQAPASLRGLCTEALLLDGTLQIIYAKGDSDEDTARDELIGAIRGLVNGLPGTLEHNSPESRGFEEQMLESIFGTIQRVQETQAMYRAFREAKTKADLHRRWAALLNQLAVDNPGLLPYASDPRTSDPSWHFLHDHLGGDDYFGLSRDSTRTSRRDIVHAAPHSIGNLRDGPIRVHFSSQSRAFGYVLQMQGPSNGEIYVGHCKRGHFGFFNENGPSAWITRTMTDNKKKGRLAFPGDQHGNLANLSVIVWHFATAGYAEESETDGDILFYLDFQYHSDAEAAKAARTVNL